MHHVLKFYSLNQEFILRFYMLGAKLTRIPLLGKLVRLFMEWYASQHNVWVLTRDEAKKVIDASTSIAVGRCRCREVFGNCDNPLETDIVIGVGSEAFRAARPDEYRVIGKEEAKEIIDACAEKGLIHTIVKCRGDFYAICNCCKCCCVPLRLRRDYGVRSVWGRDKKILDMFQF